MTDFKPQTLKDLADKKFTEPNWLVKELLVRGTVNVLWAVAGMGKSYFVLQLMASLAQGEPFLEFEIPVPAKSLYVYLKKEDDPDAPDAVTAPPELTGGKSIYYSLEGGERGLSHRASKYPWTNPAARGAIAVLFELSLVRETDFVTLTENIKTWDAALVVIDPISLISLPRNWDWNDNSIVGGFMARLDKMAVETGATVLLVHHKKKGPKDDTPNEEYDRTTATGAQSLVNLCSTRIHIRGFGHGERVLYVFGKDVPLTEISVRHGTKKDTLWRRAHKYIRDVAVPEGLQSPDMDLRSLMGLYRCGECGVWSSDPSHSRHVIGSLGTKAQRLAGSFK